MSFYTPEFDQVDESGNNVPDEGRVDVTVTAIEPSRSSKGDPMMVWTETIDNGPNAGYDWKEFFAFKEGSMLAWARLKSICLAAGIEWGEATSLEKFCAQFPLNEIRFSVEIEHQYSIKAFIDSESRYDYTQFSDERTEETPNESWIQVQKSEWEEWEGEKNVRAQPRDGFDFQNIYQPPQNDPELQFTEDGMERQPALAGGDGAAAEGFEPDDELPF